MRTLGQVLLYVALGAMIAITPVASDAQTANGVPPKYSPDVPAEITTPPVCCPR